MIVGVVQNREALIRLTIRGFRGREQEIEAVVDSGYTGWLTSSRRHRCPRPAWQTFGRVILADGSVSCFDVYRAKVVWDHQTRSVYVDEFEATPLVGMALLQGYECKMQVRTRGRVTIKRLPRK